MATKWEKIERMRNKYYGKYARKFKRILKSQSREVLNYIKDFSIEGLEFNIDTLINEETLKEAYLALYREVGLKFRKVTNRELSQKNLQDDLWMEEMQNYVELNAFQKIAWINKTTRDVTLNTLRKIIADQVDEGLSVGETKRRLIKELRQEYGRIEDWRALRIAHTEVMTASNVATAMTEADITIPVRKVWITAAYGVARTQERHTLMGLDEQKPLKGMPFNVGSTMMQYPGDPAGGPENVINCRCALAYEPIELN